jgi:hypothetical protein
LATRDYSCGPIVGTTRSVYRKKLVDLILAADYPSEGLNATHSDPSEPSEDEEEEEPPKVKVPKLIMACAYPGMLENWVPGVCSHATPHLNGEREREREMDRARERDG